MKPARLRPQARQDRLAEIRHYRDAAGSAVAEAFVMSAEQALDLLEQQPGLGSPKLGQLLDIPALRSWRISGFPLMWLYIEQSDHLDVVRLLGERQDLLAILGADKSLSAHEPAASYSAPT